LSKSPTRNQTHPPRSGSASGIFELKSKHYLIPGVRRKELHTLRKSNKYKTQISQVFRRVRSSFKRTINLTRENELILFSIFCSQALVVTIKGTIIPGGNDD
jgi:hypothetical protein